MLFFLFSLQVSVHIRFVLCFEVSQYVDREKTVKDVANVRQVCSSANI